MESRQLNATETERIDNETGPSARAFDKMVQEVKGYRLATEPKDASKEFRAPSAELLALIPKPHKSAFFNLMYSSDAVFVDDNDDVVLGGDMTLPVDLYIGSQERPHAIIRFDLPEPSETEREKFIRKASQLRENQAAKTRKIVTDLRATIEFFVDLMSRPGASVSPNGKVNGVSFADATDKRAWASQVDPIYMQFILGTAFTKYNARRQDS